MTIKTINSYNAACKCLKCRPITNPPSPAYKLKTAEDLEGVRPEAAT